MSKISVAYQRSHDIDWFAKVGSVYIHALSFGGLLPASICNWDLLRKMLRKAYQLPVIANKDSLIYNHRYIDSRLSAQFEMQQVEDRKKDDIRNRYISHFREMALRGFYSFDRDLDDDGQNRYCMVVKPKQLLLEWNIDLREFEWPHLSPNSQNLSAMNSFNIVVT